MKLIQWGTVIATFFSKIKNEDIFKTYYRACNNLPVSLTEMYPTQPPKKEYSLLWH